MILKGYKTYSNLITSNTRLYRLELTIMTTHSSQNAKIIIDYFSIFHFNYTNCICKLYLGAFIGGSGSGYCTSNMFLMILGIRSASHPSD